MECKISYIEYQVSRIELHGLSEKNCLDKAFSDERYLTGILEP